ncbi:histidine kinase [Streptomyces beijiangensis]|uniref:Histidine kinase n=1 Tax=Streptomyces beijiangensis TaxID=163361 RepID=A0A939F7X6_9ACTN|nr:histidine kinase [Streptomyces beijiangensis]MBO0512085.1 histidine kinase [Streptomyces beijiangensis]
MTENHHVLLIAFSDPERCRAAYEEALQLPGLRQAAILERSAEGLIDVPENHVRGAGVPTVGGGVVGGLVGLLGGPIGVLIGSAAGAALANARENRQLMEGGAGLIMLSGRVDDGVSMLVLDLHESSPDPADELAGRHGGTVERLSEKEFTEQVEAAERAAEEPDTP